MKFEDALMAVRGGATAYHEQNSVVYWLALELGKTTPVVVFGNNTQKPPNAEDVRADWTVIGAKAGAVATAPVADDFQYVSENVWDKAKEWDELASHLNGLGVPDADGVDNWTLRERVEWYVKAARKYDASGVAPSMPHLSDIEHPEQHAKPDAPLSGDWHHGNGVLVCGTVRIAREDFDTNPAESFKTEMFDWMCETLNAATQQEKPDQHKQLTPEAVKRSDWLVGNLQF
jgi:hypothetical protein